MRRTYVVQRESVEERKQICSLDSLFRYVILKKGYTYIMFYAEICY